ncbi:transglycosylase SLT domain-containing protein [Campylobacter sp. RM16187]|uniref:transglycosylase SLT domain-containing protein n=1 Tax=Campylobacter sp. RM16187 TaxID=1660063 RepID=UPI0021B639E2|nr:transglycosylase SLT domain-containing protein [Campylobacter sp. RM16187]QKG30261.1 putative lytic transglycosylase [Campylobacter sp. RM16187]
MKSILFLISMICLLSGYSDQDIADGLRMASVKSNIDKRVLYTIAKIESDFTPLIISFTSHNKDHDYPNLKRSIGKYKNKYLISFRGDKESLKAALENLIEKGYRVDAGLMQINSVNFSKDEIDDIFNIEYNIDKSISVLKMCVSLTKNTKQAIECYNKGKKSIYSNYDYYEKFKNNYLMAFAKISNK